MKFINTIIKNMKLLFRSKSTTAMVLLGPLVLVLLVGLAFNNTSNYEITIGTYSKDYNALTTRYVATLENSSYKVTRFDNLDKCINRIKDGTINTCIAFPDDFAIENENEQEILFYVDYSRLNLVYLVLGTLAEGVEHESTELTEQYATVLVDKISSTEDSIQDIIKDTIGLKQSNKVNIENLDEILDLAESIDFVSGKANLSKVKSEAESIYDSAEDIQKNGKDAIDEGYDFIRSLIGKTINATSEINDFKDNLVDINESLDEMLNSTKEDYDDLLSSITSATKDIDNINKKLDDAKKKNTELIVKIKDLKKKMESLEISVSSLKTKLEGIIEDLNSIELRDAERIAKPVNSRIEPVIAENTKLSYLFPSFLVLVIMFIGILLSSTLVITEKSSRAFFRVNTTPTSDTMFIISTFVTSFLVIIAQVAIVLSCAFYFLKTPILDNYQLTFVVLFLSISFFTLLGMLIGYLFSTQEATGMISISLSALFLFLSNLVLPLESMSEYIQKVAYYNPYVILSEMSRKSFLFQGTFNSLQMHILLITAACVVLFIAVYLGQKFTKMRYFSRIPHMRKKLMASKKECIPIEVGGTKLCNEFELLSLIDPMPENQYYNLMEKHRQDLMTWAEYRLRDKKLAKKLTKSKLEIIEYLQKKKNKEEKVKRRG